MNNRYKSINTVLKERFGERVYKVSLELGLGCPNRDGLKGSTGCTFCHAEALRPNTAKDSAAPRPSLAEQLAEGIAYIRARHGTTRSIAYFQNGSNTYARAHHLRPAFLEAAAHPAIVGLAISTRPDCIEDEHVQLLKEISGRTMLWVELGLQSACDETLVRIGRGHAVWDFEKAFRKLSAARINVCAHVVLGLPGESIETMLTTARFLNELGIWGAKIHNLHVLKDTPMEADYARGDVYVPTLKEYASWVVDFLEALSPEIIIHRFNSHSPRRLTIAPEWSVNKMATLNAVHAELERRDSWQGKGYVSR